MAPTKLYFLLAVTVDTDAMVEDRPPERIDRAIVDEMHAHLDDDGTRAALGILEANIDPVGDEVARYALRCETWDRRVRG